MAAALKGSENKYISPLGKQHDPILLIVAFDEMFQANRHKINDSLLAFELEQRARYGPRSRAKPWIERKPGLLLSFQHQIDNFIPPFYDFKDGKGNLNPLSQAETINKVKRNTNSGFPRLTTKGKCMDDLIENFDELIEREDPCILFTRTAECKKTRNVWGYPFADMFYELMFFTPFLAFMREKFWQASVISPELVDERLTMIILEAISSGRLLYSVDFDAFDASVSWQTIILAFDYIKSCYDPVFGPYIDRICKRFYTIAIVTPTGILRGKHGVPSGSCFTNTIDSIVQAATALTNDFIHECEMMINGDDGVYIVAKENISKFQQTFRDARFKLGIAKSNIAEDWCTYCQRFYHIDYLKDDLIGGIYPVYRALNRLVWLESFSDLRKMKISSRDHFGIRTLTILEQCKYHPMFEDIVRFVLEREKFALKVSEDGLAAYTAGLAKGCARVEEELNLSESHTFVGIKNFESYKLVQKIISEEGYFDIVDQEALDEPEVEYI